MPVDEYRALAREVERAITSVAAMVRKTENKVDALDESLREHSRLTQEHRTNVEVRLAKIESELAFIRRDNDQNKDQIKDLSNHKAMLIGGKTSIREIIGLIGVIVAIITSLIALFR